MFSGPVTAAVMRAARYSVRRVIGNQRVDLRGFAVEVGGDAALCWQEWDTREYISN